MAAFDPQSPSPSPPVDGPVFADASAPTASANDPAMLAAHHPHPHAFHPSLLAPAPAHPQTVALGFDYAHPVTLPACESPPPLVHGKRYRSTPAKTFQCAGYGECRMVFSRSEHLARHIRCVFFSLGLPSSSLLLASLYSACPSHCTRPLPSFLVSHRVSPPRMSRPPPFSSPFFRLLCKPHIRHHPRARSRCLTPISLRVPLSTASNPSLSPISPLYPLCSAPSSEPGLGTGIGA
ncbi:hypothetical protein GGX14DRAFT_698627 [Mycena pura]|uniref:C2H2-type domain-containing protein n=1 Tax=Mycena pura TaxID=153505 RepID=A0AAD6YE62_9AGAR|nr:hypothetical protein GGX14DRAFT_698627 [Mycena pura]